MRSLLMVLALAAVQRGDGARRGCGCSGTALFGLIFLGFQAYEFTHFVHEGSRSSRTCSARRFFVLTGLPRRPRRRRRAVARHLFVLDLRGRLGPQDATQGRDGAASTGTSSTWCGSPSSPSSTCPLSGHRTRDRAPAGRPPMPEDEHASIRHLRQGGADPVRGDRRSRTARSTSDGSRRSSCRCS